MSYIEYFETLFAVEDDTVKQIARIDPTFQENPKKKTGLKTQLVKVTPNSMTNFKTQSRSVKGKWWNQQIFLMDLDKVIKANIDKSIEFIISRAMQGNVKVWCDCPKFLYWGYQYKAWTLGYGVVKENRYPSQRNARLKGNVCHHLQSLFDNYSSYKTQLSIGLSRYVRKRR